ncbi:hypothetical protein L7F22_031069 [Adiantum nelumboides]|nr:hypothetical protein [Adiantum nelumboides]
MHQRHPIRVDKSRALPAGTDRQITGSTQLSFHKIYRQKRCYSNFDKGKEGFSNGLWKSDCGNTSRDSNILSEPRYSTGHNDTSFDKVKEGFSSGQWKADCGNSLRESNIVSEPRYFTGHNGFKSARRIDYKETIKSGSPSSLSLSTGSAKSDREFPKRSFDRSSCNFLSGSEFDAPVVKKQKVEPCRSSAPQLCSTPEYEHSKWKLSLDETKWMYKNQHAKMSGPYGVKQLMEGLQSRFLQEDLPIYQLSEGKLCKPITLKQLLDDIQQTMQESGRRQSNQSMPSQRSLQVFTEEKIGCDDDLPPGFGGRCSQFPQKTFCEFSPNSMTMVPGSRFPAHGFSSSGSDFGENDFGLPPGFEGGAVIESQTPELCGTPQNLPSIASGFARRGGLRVMHSGYEQVEPVAQDRALAWQDSSPHSVVAYSNQGTTTGSEMSSSGHTAWAYPPAATNVPSFEPQTLLQSTVCIGLPVNQSATRSWPIASNLSSGVFNAEPYSYPNAATLTNKKLATEESTGFSERQSPDPLSLILSELLAAVKRTYVNSVLSALIGEQLDCWSDANKHWIGRVLSLDNKASPARGACHTLSRTEVDMCSVEVRTLNMEASVSADTSALHVEASPTTFNHPNVLIESRDAQGLGGSLLVDHAASLGTESRQLCLTETVNDVNPYTLELADTLLLSDGDKCASKKAENFSVEPIKVESSLSSKVTCKSKFASFIGNETSLILSAAEEKMQHKSDASIGRFHCSGNTSDAIQLEAKPPLLAARHKKENMKSLKQLMAITSKLRLARLKNGMSKKSENKILCSVSPKVLEFRQRCWILASGCYDGCARTSVCGSWKTEAQEDGHCIKCNQTKDRRSLSGVSCMQRAAHSGRSCNATLGSVTAAVEDSDLIKLTLSKLVSKRRLKVARSKIHQWGVFFSEAVEADGFVIEYLGELVRSRIADIREKNYARLGIGSGYLFRVDNESAVDATKRGGLARFINHSCDPNCYVKVVSVDGSKRVLFFATRHIEAGEEVTYDYQSVLGVLNVPCSCGSSKCRGFRT